MAQTAAREPDAVKRSSRRRGAVLKFTLAFAISLDGLHIGAHLGPHTPAEGASLRNRDAFTILGFEITVSAKEPRAATLEADSAIQGTGNRRLIFLLNQSDSEAPAYALLTGGARRASVMDSLRGDMAQIADAVGLLREEMEERM